MKDTIKFVIITPDGTGSKGDEAMVSGMLNLLQGERALLLTQNHKQWCDVLLGKTHLFDEKTVPLEKMPENLPAAQWLIVIGADLLDGSCGYDAAYWRLHTIEAAVSKGMNVAVFCSIRSDMDERVIQKWKTLPQNVHVFIRDSVSEKNFADQVGYPAQHFSDLAFFAKPIRTNRAEAFLNEVKQLKTSKTIIGLQISETMFRSFNTETTDEARKSFAEQVAQLAVSGTSEIAVVLLTHDTRDWDGHWSDYRYACAALEQLKRINGVSCIVQPPELTQAELLAVVAELDLVICGRMHMSITACCSGVVPLVVAGEGKNYVMVDKVRGMCREWLGFEHNLLLNIAQIPQHRDLLLQDPQTRKLLKQKQEEQKETLPHEYKLLGSVLGIQETVWDKDAQQETALLRAMSRASQLSETLHEERACRKNQEIHVGQLVLSERQLQSDLKCKEGHIEQLLESERSLQADIRSKEAHIEQLLERERSLQADIRSKEAYIEQLLESERSLQAENAKKSQQLQQLLFDVGYYTATADGLRKSNAALKEQLDAACGKNGELLHRLGNFAPEAPNKAES